MMLANTDLIKQWHPFVQKLFDPEVNLYNQITNLEYIQFMAKTEVINQIMSKLNERHHSEMKVFGSHKFQKLLRSNPDRRLLFRLIKEDNDMHITLD